MAKVGRNAPCPCGSGNKYKRCHGSPRQRDEASAQFQFALAREEAAHLQRQRQQGHGRPIISTKFAGHRVVAVKNRLIHSQKWQTFHDFLKDYIVIALGTDWGNSELAKPLDQRHPVLLWYHYLCEHQSKYITEPGKVSFGPMTGAVGAYMHLAYDLYQLDHNVELQEKLIGRLRDPGNFEGARYEVFVAATLIRAGFAIEFENEDDRRTTHCEFTATYTPTGRRFSVEAKHRAGNKFRLGRHLHRALKKNAKYERIVFLDINMPDSTSGNDGSEHLEIALRDLKSFEGTTFLGKPLPNAYLVVTNTPWHHHLEGEIIRCSGVMDGFQLPDFKRGMVEYPSLRAAIEARERHIEMERLLQSMIDHSDVPSTFDGEIPEFAFGEGAPRLINGQSYLVASDDGTSKPGLLTSPMVMENEKRAYGVLTFADGTSAIYNWPLSDAEMAAWRRHPDTFFGTVTQRSNSVNTPLELYDFFLASAKGMPRERLLEFFANAPDYDELKLMDYQTLASVHAERLANGVLARNGGKLK